jgi:hypothetical protein
MAVFIVNKKSLSFYKGIKQKNNYRKEGAT